MRLGRFKKPVKGDFVLIDSMFPQKEPFGFRNAEANQYIDKIAGFKSYTMYTMFPEEGAPFGHSYGVSKSQFKENKKGYLEHHPLNGSHVQYLEEGRRYRFKLAYSFFLADTYTLLPFLEKNKIPFVFTLYPGGLFSVLSKESNDMLKRIFSSPYFRRVIVTQRITRDHLIKNSLCTADRIDYIYGGLVQFSKHQVKSKKFYPNDKKTFDICFVAAKYSPKGVDKGYDLFVAAAKKIAAQTEDVRFHIVGNFDENDIDVSSFRNKVTFYGFQKPSALLNFYRTMDVYISPNRPFKLYEGNFDGFPLGVDAGYCGTAMFVSDKLKMNDQFENEKDIVIVPLNAEKIATKVLEYYNDTERLYELSLKGMKKSQELFDVDYQVDRRIEVFEKIIDLKKKGG